MNRPSVYGGQKSIERQKPPELESDTFGGTSSARMIDLKGFSLTNLLFGEPVWLSGKAVGW